MPVGNRNNISMSQTVEDMLNGATKELIGKIFDDAITKAVEEVNQQRDEIIAKTAIRLRSWTSIQDQSNQLVITIEKPKDAEYTTK